MIVSKFGNGEKVIMFLHGGGLGIWSLKCLIECFESNYTVLAVDIDGHGKDYNNDFISINNTATKLIEYVNNHYNGKIYCLAGLSLGAQIVVDVLSLKPDVSDFAVVESGLFLTMPTAEKLSDITYNLCYPLVKKRWFSKLQAKQLMIENESFENYFTDSKNMSKVSLINISKSNANFGMPENISNTLAKVLIICGDKEPKIMLNSAEELHKKLSSQSEKLILQGYKHGQLSLTQPRMYFEILEGFFVKNK